MSDTRLPDPSPWGGAVLLPDVGVIQAEGADAASFLHGQLSQDITGQPATAARLAAYCSAKGRMQASLLSLRPAPETVWLLADRQLVPGLVKRLSMFVLRAKAKLSDTGDTLQVVGLVGQAAAEALGTSAQATSQDWQAQPHAGGLLVKLPTVLGAARWYWVGPAAGASAWTAALPALPIEQWQWLDVMSGIARISTATVDQFVPQMLNYELIGGVNFQKGCYPGQEVVARSQYRGTTKRRAFVVQADKPVEPGQEIFSEADPGQPAGMIVNAAPVPGSANSSWSAVAEIKLSALQDALFAGAVGGAKLSLGEQPYAIAQAEEAL